MTKVTLGLQNPWQITDTAVGILQRDLPLAEIRSSTLLGNRRGQHYNRGQYSSGSTVFYTILEIVEQTYSAEVIANGGSMQVTS